MGIEWPTDELHDGFTPPEHFYFVAMFKSSSPMNVTVNGADVPIVDCGSTGIGGCVGGFVEECRLFQPQSPL